MDLLTLLIVGLISIVVGSILGYYARQSIAKRRAGTIEQKLQKKTAQTKEEGEQIIEEARIKAKEVFKDAKEEE
ncbi:ribonuclease Y, partial [Patescibacteria group bacterium]|nr:ribonuclease Y [Patescibacteria group bacterium]